MRPESNNIEEYLKYDSVIDWNNPHDSKAGKKKIIDAVSLGR